MKSVAETKAYLSSIWIRNGSEVEKIKTILQKQFPNETEFELRSFFIELEGITAKDFKQWLKSK